MGWSISELDKNKTESCISNETIRVDTCKEYLNNLKNEFDKFCHDYNMKIIEYENKIANLESAILSGEKFLEECNNHLKDFE